MVHPRAVGNEMKREVALGMYTVHREAATDMEVAFVSLAQMGYRGIEFYGEPDFVPAAVARALAASGLTLTSWHIEWRNLQPERISETLDYLARVGCPVAVIPCLGGKWNVGHAPEDESRELWLRYVDRMNAIDAVVTAGGLRLGYHNHEHEFQLSYDGESVFDLLFSRLSPDIVMELDTGNCIEGGDDPVAAIRRYPDRDLLLHLKPYSFSRGFDTQLAAPDDANDWQAILAAAPERTLGLIIESENTASSGMESARLCIEGLRSVR